MRSDNGSGEGRSENETACKKDRGPGHGRAPGRLSRDLRKRQQGVKKKKETEGFKKKTESRGGGPFQKKGLEQKKGQDEGRVEKERG
jgi:hypothetical protein